jgi:hypothetical protein
MRIFVIGLRADCLSSTERKQKKPPPISESYLMARMCPPGVGTYVRRLISLGQKRKRATFDPSRAVISRTRYTLYHSRRLGEHTSVKRQPRGGTVLTKSR